MTTALTDRLENAKAAQDAGLAPGAQKGLSVLGWLQDGSTAAELARALPRGMDAGRFARIVQTEVRKEPKLLACTPQSFILAVLNAAQLGLEPGPLGHSYLIPFKNKGVLETTLILGYKGLKDLAYRGGVDYLDAVSVHEGEPFRVQRGSDPKIEHEERPECAANPVIAYYAVAIPKASFRPVFEVMWPKDIIDIRKRSRAGDSGPWVTDYEAMAQKTVIRRMLNRGKVRLTSDMAVAIQEDEARELGFERPDVLNTLTALPAPEDGEGRDTSSPGDSEAESGATQPQDAPTEPDKQAPEQPSSSSAEPQFPPSPTIGQKHVDEEGVVWHFNRGGWSAKEPTGTETLALQ